MFTHSMGEDLHEDAPCAVVGSCARKLENLNESLCVWFNLIQLSNKTHTSALITIKYCERCADEILIPEKETFSLKEYI